MAITLHDIKPTGAVLDAALAAGANQIHGVQFGVKDNSAAKQAALKQAAVDAQGKAKAIAEAMGVDLGAVAYVQEQGVRVAPPMPMHHARMMASDAGATPMQPGLQTIHAQLTVSYRINR